MNAKRKNFREETYKKITDAILKALKSGVAPWTKTWVGGGSPANAVTKKSYRGVNRILLSCAPYTCRFFATQKQIEKLKGTVLKGEFPFEVIFWNFKMIDVQNKKTGKWEQKKVPMMRLYNVYNLEQTEGIDMGKYMGEISNANNVFNGEAKQIATAYLKKYKIKLSHGGGRASYSPMRDAIRMPALKRFKDGDAYGATLFHEITHSTGHTSRLKRGGITDGHHFGSVEYSYEELVAEMGASFLASLTGISNEAGIKNSASYIKGWMSKIKEDPMLVIDASSKAQKATDFVINASPSLVAKSKPKKKIKGHVCKWCADEGKRKTKNVYMTTVSYDEDVVETKGWMCEDHREAWWNDGYDVSWMQGKTKYELV